jgi:cytochrome c-type biogenesis protein CcmH/NrfF
MSRPPLLLLAAAALIALAALLAVNVFAPASDADRAAQADAIAAELRCPDCQALSVADSPTESAAEIRRQIDAMLAAGRSPDEVRAHFVARYGDWILLAPDDPLAWALPPLTLLAAALALAAWLWRGRGTRRSEPTPITAPDLARVRDEAEALDA